MARKRRRASAVRPEPGPQAPPGVWTPAELLEAIKRPSRAEKAAMLREVGILDSRGKLAKKYRTWGGKVSRTESA